MKKARKQEGRAKQQTQKNKDSREDERQAERSNSLVQRDRLSILPYLGEYLSYSLKLLGSKDKLMKSLSAVFRQIEVSIILFYFST